MSTSALSLFSSSIPNGSQNPETGLYRLSHSHQNQRSTFTSTQALVDQGATHFIEGVFDSKTSMALLAGGMANPLGRLGVMTLGQRLGSGPVVSFLVRGSSHIAGMAVESAIFAGINHGFDSPFFGKNWAHAAATLGPLKLFPALIPNQNIVLRHLIADIGMVGGEHLAYHLNVGEKPEGDLTTQLARAEAVTWQMKGTLSVLHGFSPSLHAINQSMESLLQAQSNNPAPLEIFGPLNVQALAAEGGPPVLLSPSQGGRGNSGNGTPRFLNGEELALNRFTRGDVSARALEGESGGDSAPPHGSLVPLPKTRYVMGSETPGTVACNNEAPARVVEVKGYFLRKTPTTWMEYFEYAGDQAGELFGITARNKQTGLMEVLHRGTERRLQNLLTSFKSLEQMNAGSHEGYELARVVRPVFRIPVGLENHPIVEVTWPEALGFSDWWGRKYAGKPGHLPTEAQKENGLRGEMVEITDRMREEGLDPQRVAPAQLTAWVMGEMVKGQRVQGRFGRYENFVLMPEPGQLLELSAGIFTNPSRSVLRTFIQSGRRLGGFRVFPTERGDFNDTAIYSSVMTNKKGTRPVDEGMLSPSGLMIGGNVWEWGNDWYGDSYRGLPAVNPSGPAQGELRVFRVGSFFSNHPGVFRASLRGSFRPSRPWDLGGFRVAL